MMCVCVIVCLYVFIYIFIFIMYMDYNIVAVGWGHILKDVSWECLSGLVWKLSRGREEGLWGG